MAILAEKYAVDYSWYVDTILNLIRIAGDYVSEEVWYRVIQIVINRDDVQGYAAKTVFEVGVLGPFSLGCSCVALGRSLLTLPEIDVPACFHKEGLNDAKAPERKGFCEIPT